MESEGLESGWLGPKDIETGELDTTEVETGRLDTGGLSIRQAELSATSCAIKLRDYSRLQDKTVKQESSCGWIEPIVILKIFRWNI